MRKVTLTTKDGGVVTTTLASSISEAIRITGARQVVAAKIEQIEVAEHCHARRYADEMQCHHCGLAWDVNDVLPPECRK